MESNANADVCAHSSSDLKPSANKTHARGRACVQPNGRRRFSARKNSRESRSNRKNRVFSNVRLKVVFVPLEIINFNFCHFIDLLQGREPRRILHCSPMTPDVVEIGKAVVASRASFHICAKLFKTRSHRYVNWLVEPAIYCIVKSEYSQHKLCA